MEIHISLPTFHNNIYLVRDLVMLQLSYLRGKKVNFVYVMEYEYARVIPTTERDKLMFQLMWEPIELTKVTYVGADQVQNS